MKYLSVCSGIEAATVAWHSLSWQPIGFSEIEAFPSAVLAHHYSGVRNYGDMTRYKEWDLEPIDLLVGGTPCQSFSVAGLRKGLDDPRGNLALVYCGILDHLRPKWCVWENVPGVLSSNGGRDFGSFLGAVAELGYGFAYRVLDAQYFGVAQRRRRVFVVGYLGDWRPAAEVLFEPESLRGNPAPSREAGQEVAGTFTARARSGGWGHDPNLAAAGYMRPVAKCLTAKGNMRYDWETEDLIPSYAIQGNMIGRHDSAGPQGMGISEEISFTLTKADQHGVAQPIAFDGYNQTLSDTSQTIRSDKSDGDHVGMVMQSNMAVRRLTPTECERLQGFPDGYTNIPWRKAIDSPDGPRYKALGNSMAVPVMRWIGERIQLVMPKPAG